MKEILLLRNDEEKELLFIVTMENINKENEYLFVPEAQIIVTNFIKDHFPNRDEETKQFKMNDTLYQYVKTDLWYNEPRNKCKVFIRYKQISERRN